MGMWIGVRYAVFQRRCEMRRGGKEVSCEDGLRADAKSNTFRIRMESVGINVAIQPGSIKLVGGSRR